MRTNLSRAEVTREPPKRYLRKGQVAERYGITTRSVDRMAEDGRLPAPVHLGKFPLWDEARLDEHDRALAREAVVS